jgi:hypothetical protein
VFDLLDPIDCTCLGLTNKRFYAVLRHLYGSVPLSCQRLGPNDMEWEWNWTRPSKTKCTYPMRSQGSSLSQDKQLSHSTWSLAVSPQTVQGFCRHCGANRCELYRHLYCWMGVDGHLFEYCSVTERFLPPADKSPVEHCFLTKPGWPRRCGRHSYSSPSSSCDIVAASYSMVKV